MSKRKRHDPILRLHKAIDAMMDVEAEAIMRNWPEQLENKVNTIIEKMEHLEDEIPRRSL